MSIFIAKSIDVMKQNNFDLPYRTQNILVQKTLNAKKQELEYSPLVYIVI